MARRIDDIGDGPLSGPEKLRLLAEARAGAIDPAAHRDDPVLLGLDDAARRLPIPLAAFGELIDGCEMDVSGRHYERSTTSSTTAVAWRGRSGGFRWACSIRRCDRRARPRRRLADALGIALQLTNILRDIREDLQNGRIYLPERDLDLFGCELRILPTARWTCDGALAEVIRFEAARAWGWSDRGLGLIPLLDRRSAACCAAMAGIYHDLLARIAADPTLRHGRAALAARAPKAADRGTFDRASRRAPWLTAAVVVGGGLAGIAAALRLPTAGGTWCSSSAGRASAGGPSPSGAGPCRSTTASTCSCAAAPPTVAVGRLGAGDEVTLQRHLDIPVLAQRRAQGAPSPRARRPGAGAPRRCARALRAAQPGRPGAGRPRRPGAAPARSGGPDPRRTDARRLPARARPERRDHHGPLGRRSRRRRSIWPPTTRPWRWRPRSFGPGCSTMPPASDVGYAARPARRSALGRRPARADRRGRRGAARSPRHRDRTRRGAGHRRATANAGGRPTPSSWRPRTGRRSPLPPELARIARGSGRRPRRDTDRQHPRHLRPSRDRSPVRGGGRFTRAVVLRPHRGLGPARGRADGAVPGDHRVGRRRDRRAPRARR